jgi:rhodanese-related sulfurtransferase
MLNRSSGPVRVVVEATIVALVMASAGLAFNALQSEGIPLVAEKEYEILVPCPEPIGETGPVEPAAALNPEPGTMVVDARYADEFGVWHAQSAIHVLFDYLEPVPDEKLKELIRSGARQVVVYGDGDDPDSGREMARELSGRGLKNVYFVRGGAPALRKAMEGEVSQ